MPLVLLCIDYYQFRKIDKKDVLEKVPFFVLSLVFLVVSTRTHGVTSMASFDNAGAYILNASYGILWYLYKLIIPLKLACIYPLPAKLDGIAQVLYVASPLILLALVAVVIFSTRYTSKVLFGSLFFLLNLILMLIVGILSSSIVYDRYAYIPSIGFFYILGEGIVWLYSRRLNYARLMHLTLVSLLIGAVGFMSLHTWNRCKVWKDSRTLWTDVIQNYPNIAEAQDNLALVLAQDGEVDRAIEHYSEALRINPQYDKAHNGLAFSLAKKGRNDEAIEHFKEALRLNPHFPGAHNGLAISLAKQGENGEAIKHFKEALHANPSFYEAHNNFANCLAIEGEYDEAIEHYKEALRLNPQYANAHNNLGKALAGQGKTVEAIDHFKAALQIRPDWDQAQKNLALAQKQLNNQKYKQYNTILK